MNVVEKEVKDRKSQTKANNQRVRASQKVSQILIQMRWGGKSIFYTCTPPTILFYFVRSLLRLTLGLKIIRSNSVRIEHTISNEYYFFPARSLPVSISLIHSDLFFLPFQLQQNQQSQTFGPQRYPERRANENMVRNENSCSFVILLDGKTWLVPTQLFTHISHAFIASFILVESKNIHVPLSPHIRTLSNT